MKIRFGYYQPINSPTGRAVTWILLAIGILMTLCSIPGTVRYYQTKDQLVEATATIDRIEVTGHGDDKKHQVYVSYSYEGQRYEDISLNHWNSGMDVGDHVTIRIHPDDPGKPVRNVGGMFLLFGLFYSAVSLAFWILARRPDTTTARKVSITKSN